MDEAEVQQGLEIERLSKQLPWPVNGARPIYRLPRPSEVALKPRREKGRVVIKATVYAVARKASEGRGCLEGWKPKS